VRGHVQCAGLGVRCAGLGTGHRLGGCRECGAVRSSAWVRRPGCGRGFLFGGKGSAGLRCAEWTMLAGTAVAVSSHGWDA
jgi:hypothetical protein